jgi:8-oxo-dGTP pyrophosphatase MutT (NUDIX family)/phosphohistidine phosphatase SixA
VERTSGADRVLAAGAVLWRPGRRGDVEVALVHRPKYDDWSLPKGKVEDSESLPVCAVREVLEETGYGIRLGRPLGTQTYAVRGSSDGRPSDGEAPGGGQRTKEVHWWAAEAAEAGGDGAGCSAPWEPSAEIDDVVWLEVDAAAGRLTRPDDAALVRRAARDALRRTTAFTVLRHALSVPRSTWDGPDDQRPLTDDGRAQATALVPMFAAFGARSVVTSPAERCVATVRPYATQDRAGRPEVTVRVDEAFDEHEVGHAAKATRALLVDVDRGLPTVVCTHRQTLPVIMQSVAGSTAVTLPLRPLPKGAFHVLHVADGQVVGSETHRPPRHEADT